MSAGSSLFFQSDASKDTLNKRVRPSDEQMDMLRKKKAKLEDHLRADLRDRCGCTISTWLQGSYKLHTLIRPVHKYDDYDVDIGVYLEWGHAEGEPPTAATVRDFLHASMQAFKRVDSSVKKIEEPPRERCSRAHYEKQFHIDIPAYHHNTDTGVARLATLSSGWEYSDPEKMVNWFQDRLEGDDRAQIRRITRYLKTWAALRFAADKESLPSSLLLTVLSVDAYTSAIGQRSLADDDALKEVVSTIFWRLSGDRRVENPVTTDQDRDLNRLSDAGFDGFMRALSELLDIATRATDCDEETNAAVAWTEAFDYLFPLPDVTGLAEEIDVERGLLVATPNIRVDISSTQGGPVLRRHNDQVDLVRLKEWLRFRITNPEHLPLGATVRWVVRNVGEHAYSENDLGHSVTDDGSLMHDETAAYHGRHFMDCEIRVGGRLRSITRVPVVVTSMQIPPRHPARPAYARLRSRRR